MWLCTYWPLLLFLQLQNDAQSHSGELDVKFQLAQDTLEMMLSSMYSIRDQLSNMVSVILDFFFSFIPKYFSKCKCGCLNMFYHLPFRMRPQPGIYPKKPMWCSLWYAWDTVVRFGLKICFYFIRFHYICCVMNESGQITLLEKDIKLWTFFVCVCVCVCVCVFLGSFNHPNHDPRIYFIVRDIKLSIHQKHPFCRLNGKFNLVIDWFNIINLWCNR